MSTQSLTRVAAALPVVNLLPPEIGERRRLRHLKAGLGVGVLATAGVVAGLYVMANADVSSAHEQLQIAKTEGARLQAETIKYANVPAVIARVDAAKLQRSQAMSQEVRWSFLLNDLSLRIPAKVWLTNLTVTQSVDAPAPAAGAAATYPVPGIGQVTFEGQAYSHNDAATWLEMLARQRGLSQAYLTNSTLDEGLASASVDAPVTFSSNATITEDALSRRFEQKAGS
jgi:Tfp pilus assembly protein PilN